MTARLLKRPNWRVHLDALVFSRLRMPFVWGQNDCALFAADAVAVMTNSDLARDLRGYTGARQALRLIQSRGGLRAIVDRALGGALPATYACTGDIALMRMGGRDALGVVINATQVAGPGADGLHVAPLCDALCAWRVG